MKIHLIFRRPGILQGISQDRILTVIVRVCGNRSLHRLNGTRPALPSYAVSVELPALLQAGFELDGERFPVKPLTSIFIKPGCRHRAIGRMKILNVPIPAFDPHDEWFD